MIITGMARLGADAELRYTSNGRAVCDLALAFNYGRKGDDGKTPSQLIEASLWEKRAEALAPYLKKGSAVSVVITDPHIETYEKKDGTSGFKLVGKIAEIEFTGERRPEGSAAPAKPATNRQSSGGGSGNSLDDEIPF